MPRVCPECGTRFDEEVRRCPTDGTPTIFISSEEALVGKVIDGRFTIRSLIGVGGMGAVYRAHQHSMDREVAIKVLRPDLSRNEQEVLRFFREARAASRLTSPYTITVYDFGQSDDGLLFLVMEFLRGSPLTAVLREQGRPLEPARAVRIASQVLQALVHAHSMGILHRDLKPDNVFLIRDDDGRERVKVLDFGIAKMIGSDSGNLTATGMVVGTPAYMSPEQAMGRELDARCDLYAVGVILFEMLTGRLPHVADTPMALVYKKISEKAPLLREVNPSANVPPQLEAVVARLLATRPEDRPGSAREALDALSCIPGLDGGKVEAAPAPMPTPVEIPPSPPVEPRQAPVSPAPSAWPIPRLPGVGWWWPAAGSLVALALVGWWLSLRPPPAPPGPGEPVPIKAGPPEGFDPTQVAPPDLPPGLADPVKRMLMAMRPGNEAEVGDLIREVVGARVAARVANLEVVAAAFLSRFSDMKEHSRPEDTVRLARLAVDIAPDLPDLHFNLARAHFGRGVAGIFSGVRALGEALKALRRHPPSLLAVLGRIAFPLAWSGILIVLFIPLLFLVRYGPLLVHDLTDRFAPSRGPKITAILRSRRLIDRLRVLLRGSPAAALLAIAILWPLVAGFGLVPGLLLAMLAVAMYASRAEIATIAFVLVLAALLVPIGIAVHLPIRSASEPGARAWSCLHAECDPETRALLKQDLEADPSSVWTRIALALHVIRHRPADPQALQEAESLLGPAEDRDGTVATLLGQVRLLRALSDCVEGRPNVGDLLAAERIFQSAAGLAAADPAKDRKATDPTHALVGLAITEQLLARRDAARSALDRLASSGADTAFFERIPFEQQAEEPCALYKTVAGELVPPRPPGWEVYLGGTNILAATPALPLSTLITGNLTPSVFSALALLVLLTLPIAMFASRRRALAARCPRCGAVSCRKCDIGATGFDTCPACLARSVRPSFVDPLDVVALQRAHERRREVWRVVQAIGSVVFPGAVQIIGGRPWRGLFLIAAVSLGIGLYLRPAHLFEVVANPGSGRGTPEAAIILLGAAVGLSALDVWARRR